MSGVFGGYLWLVDVLGGVVLFVLIGSKAFKPKARSPRLMFGSMVIGSVLGAVLMPYLLQTEGEPEIRSYLLWGVLGIVLVWGLTLILQHLNEELEKEAE
jgi:hypothetical protein